MTLAIVAFLIGGLGINANAQNKKTLEKAPQENTAGNKEQPNYDKMLKDYEYNVNQYIAYYEKALSGDKTATSDKAPTFNTYLKKAQELEATLEKAKDKLNRTQISNFLRIKQKLADALKRK